MIVTLQDGTRLTVTLRTWDGYNWSPAVAGDVLASGNLRRTRTLSGWRMTATTLIQA